MNLYSENIIFVDTEFTDLDVRKGELLSVGMIKPNGDECYVEIEHEGDVHPWVVKNVMPSLKGDAVSKKEAIKILSKFVGKDKPYMMAYVNQFDAVYWYDLFGTPKDHPFFWIPIDFASILFAHGFDPNSMGRHSFFEMLGVDKESYNLHHALDDAKMLMDIYQAFCKHISEKE